VRVKDLRGQRFGRLIAIEWIKHKGRSAWRCRCDCGAETVTTTGQILGGRAKSCGCYRVDKGKQRGADSRKHGHCAGGRSSSEYQAWSLAKHRCTNENASNWGDYGGRGITMCPRWAASFDDFLADMGEKPSKDLSIDRIDNDRGYECGKCETCRARGLAEKNCRWATDTEQNNNLRRNVLYELDGVRKTIPDWSRESGLSQSVIRNRLTLGWTLKRALRTPYEPGKHAVLFDTDD
jgi:hypothetical protein